MTHYNTLKEKFAAKWDEGYISGLSDGHKSGWDRGVRYGKNRASYLGIAILGWAWFGVLFVILIGLKIGWW